MIEKVFLVEKCVEKGFFWSNAPKRSFSGEMRRKGAFWRNASKRSFFGEMRRKGAFLEKCVEKELFRVFWGKKREMRRKGAIPVFLLHKKRNASKRSNILFHCKKKEKCVKKEQTALFRLNLASKTAPQIWPESAIFVHKKMKTDI